ncbi:MAG TPA: c-type cytochrome, partial [Candidatus Binatia bacterium]|nr:c-type cytochrome [Candidatus Binatia bacterium]
ADDPAVDTRRLLTLLSGMRTEYQEAFDGTTLVRPIELDEARLLFAEARDLNGRLALLPAADLDGLEQQLGGTATVEAVTATVDGFVARVTAATGIRDEPYAPEPPSPARGKALFDENCATCHGLEGMGNGDESQRLGLKPANFANVAFMRVETPLDFFNMISLGRRKSGMPEWGEALSVQHRWDAVSYLWTFAHAPAEMAAGEQLYATQCAGCHGAAGDGHGPTSGTTPDWTSPGSLIHASDASLFATVTDGAAGMPSFASALSEAQRWQVVSFVRALSLGGPLRPGTPIPSVDDLIPQVDAARVKSAIGEASRLLDEAVAARRAGNAGASGMATDAYMRFEPVEKRLGALDSGLVGRVEEGFVRVRTALREPGSMVSSDLESLVARLHGDLDAAAIVLEPTADGWVRFAQSVAIILREGFEMVLVIGALLTYVRRTGQTALVRPIHTGSAIGVLASLITAVLLSTLLRLTPGAGAVLEGAALLLAAGVLFWVSYWLISKSEADRWQRYIQGKVKQAIASGSGTALAAAAFLAVYREGFETVLFYQALLAGAPSGDVMVATGFVVGLGLLGLVHLGLKQVGIKIPMAQFFLVTGGLLYFMAFIFAGKGVFELQEAGVVALTPVTWGPRMPALGIYPSVETLLAQGVLVLLLVYGTAVTLRRRRLAAGTASSSVVDEPAARSSHHG